MPEPLSTEPYKGVRDFYPKDWEKLHALFTNVRTTLARWGYEEYNACPLERAELYEAKTSDEIVNDQTYTFTDRGDRRVTLRPEMTPTLARMVAAKRRELTFPLRWFSIGSRFRYERPQRGRVRSFYQADIDLIGLPEGEADIEIVQLVFEILKGYGASEKDFSIKVNSRSILNAACAAAGLIGDDAKKYIRLLDKKAKMSADEFKTATELISKKDPLTFLDSKIIETFIAELRKRGVSNVVFDPSITRGFDYYTGIVFEVFDTDPANTRSLFGGGRYDNLMSLFGGEKIPAIGFAFSDVSLTNFLETHNLDTKQSRTTTQLYIGTPSPEDIPAAQSFANILRKKGVRIFVNLTDRALGDQIKDAVKRNIPTFIAYGADEVSGTVSGTIARLKILATSEEKRTPVSDLPVYLHTNFPSKDA